MNPPSRPDLAPQIALPWIVRLRYGMVAAQTAAALMAHYGFGITLPLGWMALVPLSVALSNLALSRRPATSRLVTFVFSLDMIGLTLLLMLSGGSTNPFTLLYLVHITLAATILSKRATWGLGGLAILCYGLMFWIYRPVPQLNVHVGAGGNLHLAGMWISFTLAVVLVAMYSARISELLREHESSLRRMQEELAKSDRLASLATLAAGAAHELNTPLATIAVVAREMELLGASVTAASSLNAVRDDSRLIRSEVERCRGILQRMSINGAEPGGEAQSRVRVADLLQSACAGFPRERWRVYGEGLTTELRLPRNAVEQALAALVKNSLEASSSPIRIEATANRDMLCIAIADSGPGMDEETLRRIAEPFFTTKEPGRGMGLGTFLARTVAERLGGRLTFTSTPGQGTVARFELPMNWQVERPASVEVRA